MHNAPALSATLDLAHLLGPWGIAALAILALILLRSRSARRLLARAVGRALRHVFRHTWRAAVLSTRAARLRVPLRVARRLDRREWRAMVEARQLSGLVRGRVRRTRLGLRIHVHLTGSLTLEQLNVRTGQLEHGLGVRRNSVRVKASAKRADRAVLHLVLRDPHAKPLLWKQPAPQSICRPVLIGLTESGEPVTVRATQRIVVAGTSGAGKSSVIRPIAAAAVLAPDARLTYVDLKRVEASLWQGAATTAVTPGEVTAVVDALDARMRARLAAMEARGVADHTPTAAEPAEIIVVDEGAELVRADLDGVIDRLASIAQLGRAAHFWLIWATQYPVAANKGGLPVAIGTQAEATFGMRVETPRINREVFDETAAAAGWKANELPAGGGWFLLKDAAHTQPERARAYYATDDDVRALPRWAAIPAQLSAAPEDAVPVGLSGVGQVVPAPTPTSADTGNPTPDTRQPTGLALRVWEALILSESVSIRGLAREFEVHPSSVQGVLQRFVTDGQAVRLPDRTYALVTADEPTPAATDAADTEEEI